MNIASIALALADRAPDPADVKPGWLAFGVFLLLAAAVVLLAFSLTKHLRRTKTNFEQMDGSAPDRKDTPNG